MEHKSISLFLIRNLVRGLDHEALVEKQDQIDVKLRDKGRTAKLVEMLQDKFGSSEDDTKRG